MLVDTVFKQKRKARIWCAGKACAQDARASQVRRPSLSTMEHQTYSDDDELPFDSYAIDEHAGVALSNPSPEIPPGYDGRTSWFAYDEASW